MKKKLIPVIFLVLLVGVGTFVYVGQQEERGDQLYYSGTIEGTQADLAFQVSGRVDKVLVDEGEPVAEGQALAQLDQAEFLARTRQAEANLDAAGKNLERLESLLELYQQTLPLEVEKARARVQALQSNLDELESGLRNQEVEQARLAMDAVNIAMAEAHRDKERFDNLYRRGSISEKERDATDLRYQTALKEFERAREAYGLAREGFRKESITAARARLDEGKAAMRQASGNLQQIQVTLREVETGRAQVQVAQANLELARIQLQYTTLKAPFKGILSSRNVEPGEVVTSSREVLSLIDLSVVDLKIFVGETEIGRVKPGQKAEVKIDSMPDKGYNGRVSFISPEAEFTPKIIQTHKERVKLVYLVKVSIPNPALELKPGTPADVWLK